MLYFARPRLARRLAHIGRPRFWPERILPRGGFSSPLPDDAVAVVRARRRLDEEFIHVFNVSQNHRNARDFSKNYFLFFIFFSWHSSMGMIVFASIHKLLIFNGLHRAAGRAVVSRWLLASYDVFAQDSIRRDSFKPCCAVEVRETMTKKRWLFFLYAKHFFQFDYDIMRVIAHGFDLFFAHECWGYCCSSSVGSMASIFSMRSLSNL